MGLRVKRKDVLGFFPFKFLLVWRRNCPANCAFFWGDRAIVHSAVHCEAILIFNRYIRALSSFSIHGGQLKQPQMDGNSSLLLKSLLYYQSEEGNVNEISYRSEL